MNFLIEGIRENSRTLLLSLREDPSAVIDVTVPQEEGRIRFSWQASRREWRDKKQVILWTPEARRRAAETLSMSGRRSRRICLFVHAPMRYSPMSICGACKIRRS